MLADKAPDLLKRVTLEDKNIYAAREQPGRFFFSPILVIFVTLPSTFANWTAGRRPAQRAE